MESVQPAEGVFAATWLLILLPLVGAAVLLLGGRRLDRIAPVFGTVMPALSFGYALVLFVTPLIILEWCLDPDPREEDRGFFTRPAWAPVLAHAVIVFFIVRYGVATSNAFIYFQF